ncbi:glycoside hydrolase family 76 protein [Babjeviella inositovora NRRL Y-12698]|uniref:mannan endo-1,6-alpha-mannosidase n=1 Tax=Babjeviella inositovora NRRL Y-12698 TaxID=984486 RepID=A0A1E3QML2_9ASCO|nr:glycoside hydrolase family 76 protein [Babjeviella inositovora NRRL Y-12698]ODQ78237.1 glycoside hydrolase family 76 protein [Babjeviella inositovora NRRL Y-12698]
MWSRWDPEHCNGGLRWQIFSYNSGYNYKNSISNGGLFLMAARLARYTDNATYGDTAETVWEWVTDIGFINNSTSVWQIWDGANIEENCTDFTKIEWSYNYGVYLAGCAYMYNYTENDIWEKRATDLLLSATSLFFNHSIMYEQYCQAAGMCNNDQRSFKSFFSRCLGQTAVLIPSTHENIMGLLTASAVGAAQSCSGGSDGHTCGTDWTFPGWDGKYGLGEQMCALEVMQNLLVSQLPPPYKNNTGGSSVGNVNAGSTKLATLNQNELTITGGDKAGAGILTAVVLAGLLGGTIWMVL